MNNQKPTHIIVANLNKLRFLCPRQFFVDSVLIDKDGFVDSGVYVGLLWGVQFVDEQDEQVGDILWIGLDDEGEKAVASFFADKSNTKHWPVGATDIHDITKDGYRHPIYGIDYGAGSVKRRFSGIKVPRSTYQF